MSGKARLLALVGSAAAGLIAVVGGFEGKSNDPYRDIVGVWTVCYGETRVPMRRYSDAECEDMLADGLADFAGDVLKRNPELRGHDPQLLAATSLAYNIGPTLYNNSTVARQFSAGNWKAACNAMLAFNRGTFARPTGNQCVRKRDGRYSCVINGLNTRRQKERAICLRGL